MSISTLKRAILVSASLTEFFNGAISARLLAASALLALRSAFEPPPPPLPSLVEVMLR
ncbi:hypothetical protein D3C87_2081590 [compost metagenome]